MCVCVYVCVSQRFTALPRFTDEQLRRLASKMEYKEFEGGTQIIIQVRVRARARACTWRVCDCACAIQGAKDDCFYVLKSGLCSVMVDGKNVGSIVPGGSFGEVALSMPGQARTASIVASEHCAAWRLSSAAYQEEINAKAKSQMAEAEEAKASPARGGWRDRKAKARQQPSQRERETDRGRDREPRGEAQSRWRSSSEERAATSLAGNSDGEKWRASEDDADDASSDHRRSGRRDPLPRRSRRRSRIRSRSFSEDDSELSLSSDDSGTDMDERGPSRLERKLLHALHEERQLRRALEKRVTKLERQVAAAFPEESSGMARQVGDEEDYDDDRGRPRRSDRKSSAGKSSDRDRDRDREMRSAGKSKDKERSSSRPRNHRSSRR